MKALILAMSLVILSGTGLLAHHTAAYLYDVAKPVAMKGTVTEVEWKNPHVIVHVDVKGGDGAIAGWTLEARAVYIMQRQGMTQDFLRAGDAVDMTVCVARDGSHQAEMRSFAAPDGSVKLVGQC
jgi:Family of unknown function (DUF6152)